MPGADEDTKEAARVLQDSLINIQGDASGANFTLDVGTNGVVAGQIRVIVGMEDEDVRLDIGFVGQPTDEQLVRPVRDALLHSGLLTIYYSSGHVITNHRLTCRQTRSAAFHQWEFADFTGYNIPPREAWHRPH